MYDKPTPELYSEFPASAWPRDDRPDRNPLKAYELVTERPQPEPVEPVGVLAILASSTWTRFGIHL